MLNYLWCFIVVFSVICAVIKGNSDDLATAFTGSAADAVELLMTLAGVMGLWSGLMKIAERSGLTALMARLFAPALKRLFPTLDRKSAAFGSITMNISANLLGMGNTATPPGLRAMRELQEMNGGGETASDEMVIFVVMNTASMQLLPTTLGSLRQSYGSEAPFEILVPVWISSAGALAAGLTIAIIGNRLRKGRAL